MIKRQKVLLSKQMTSFRFFAQLFPGQQPRKFHCSWQGACRVVKLISEVLYPISPQGSERKQMIVHFDRLKPYHARQMPEVFLIGLSHRPLRNPDMKMLKKPMMTPTLSYKTIVSLNESSANTAYTYWGSLWGQTCCSMIDGKIQLKPLLKKMTWTKKNIKTVKRCTKDDQQKA